jgi:signal peptidase I
MRRYLSLIALVISASMLIQSYTHGQQTKSSPDKDAEKDLIIFEGFSMLPGIRDGDKLTVKRFDCRGGELDVERGDVIAFWYPNDPSKVYIKRLIGLPGETVQVIERGVYINGVKLDEPYVDPKLNVADAHPPATFVKPHYYFVMGDNRDNSSDSRSWGFVPEKYIFAKATTR